LESPQKRVSNSAKRQSSAPRSNIKEKKRPKSAEKTTSSRLKSNIATPARDSFASPESLNKSVTFNNYIAVHEFQNKATPTRPSLSERQSAKLTPEKHSAPRSGKRKYRGSGFKRKGDIFASGSKLLLKTLLD